MAVFQTHDLTKRFGRFTAVDGLNLRVDEGDLYGFLGINGAGKTTTIRTALRLMRPTSGRVTIFGRDVDLETMRQVGALVERPAYYPGLTGYRNVELMGRLTGGVTRARALDILDQVGLAEKAHLRAHTYSHGMVQRLGIATALVTSPRLAVLDEPTNGLDPAGILLIRGLIQRLNRKGTTFIISSHLLHEVEATCNRVGMIHRGRLVVEEAVATLLRRAVTGVRIRVDDAARARAILERRGEVREEDGALVVAADPADFARINAELVGAGLAVSEFAPQRQSLEHLFLALQKEAAA